MFFTHCRSAYRLLLTLSLLFTSLTSAAGDSTEYTVDGLSTPAEIIVDEFGVPR